MKTDAAMQFVAKFRLRYTYDRLCTILGTPEDVPKTFVLNTHETEDTRNPRNVRSQVVYLLFFVVVCCSSLKPGLNVGYLMIRGKGVLMFRGTPWAAIGGGPNVPWDLNRISKKRHFSTFRPPGRPIFGNLRK